MEKVKVFDIKCHLLLLLLFIAGFIFKCAVSQKFDEIDNESLTLLKQFLIQKIDDAAIVIEALAVLNLFNQKQVLNQEEIILICIQ